MVMSKFELSFSEILDVIYSLESSVSSLKDVLRSNCFSDITIREIMFREAVARQTLLLKLRSYVHSYLAAGRA